MSAMVGRPYINEAKSWMQIAMRPNQSCAKSPRNYQSLLREIITFLDNFNDKVLGLYSVVTLDPLLYLIWFFAGLTPGEASRFAIFVWFFIHFMTLYLKSMHDYQAS